MIICAAFIIFIAIGLHSLRLQDKIQELIEELKKSRR